MHAERCRPATKLPSLWRARRSSCLIRSSRSAFHYLTTDSKGCAGGCGQWRPAERPLFALSRTRLCRASMAIATFTVRAVYASAPAPASLWCAVPTARSRSRFPLADPEVVAVAVSLPTVSQRLLLAVEAIRCRPAQMSASCGGRATTRCRIRLKSRILRSSAKVQLLLPVIANGYSLFFRWKAARIRRILRTLAADGTHRCD